MNIAIIAHDLKKPDMVAFIMKRLDFFKQDCIKIFATGTTGKHVEHAGLKNVTRLNSGPMGGDAEIAAMIVNKKIDGFIFSLKIFIFKNFSNLYYIWFAVFLSKFFYIL